MNLLKIGKIGTRLDALERAHKTGEDPDPTGGLDGGLLVSGSAGVRWRFATSARRAPVSMKTRRIAASRRPASVRSASTIRKSALSSGLAEDGGRLLRHFRRPHPGHRGSIDQLLLDRPAEEGLEARVAVAGGGRRMAAEEVLDERLEILAAERVERRRSAGRGDELGELSRRLQIGPDGLRAQVRRPEMPGERGDLALEPPCGTMCGAGQRTDHR
jgi:hypothetical protein